MTTPTATPSAQQRAPFREFFARVPTGVTVIVAQADTGPVGLVVGTFSAVSADPPLVSFMVTSSSRSWSAVRQAGRFTANILATDQWQLSQVLAGWSPDKFRDVAFDERHPESLVIRDVLGWAECETQREVEAGDHTIILATPLHMTLTRRQARPLVYFQRAYHRTLRVEELRGPGWT